MKRALESNDVSDEASGSRIRVFLGSGSVNPTSVPFALERS